MSTSTPSSASPRLAQPQALSQNPHLHLPQASTTHSVPPKGSQLPPALRSQINASLLSNGSINRIQSQLLMQLQSSGWTAAVRERCLELLRDGECATYGELMGRVVKEVRGADDISSEGTGGVGGAKGAKNGTGNGNAGGGDISASRLKVPDKVVREGVAVVRRELEGVVEVVVPEE
ncbi:MAG: hypothetical protein M1819_000408 [Sarea resinae]|nr:MAG: hypothetical protein M1819_000408 [Sarea resinae]